MKRTISLLIATLTVILCLSSCGSKDPNPDNWHNNSGINAYMRFNLGDEALNAACVFGEDGVEIYNNDAMEKELVCKITYAAKDTEPDATAVSANVDDVDGDGCDDLLFTIKTEGGPVSSVYYWSDENNAFEAKD